MLKPSEKGNFFRYTLKIRALDSQKMDFIKDGQEERNCGNGDYKQFMSIMRQK